MTTQGRREIQGNRGEKRSLNSRKGGELKSICVFFTMALIIFSFINQKAFAIEPDDPFYKNLHAPGCDSDGNPKWLKCPQWDWSLIPEECRTPEMISVNCLPRCGKSIDDKPDIVAWEYYPGITCLKPWGDWDGIPTHLKPVCPQPVGHNDYCRDCGPCVEGEGDCDNDTECNNGLVCPQSSDFNPPGVDVCQKISIVPPEPPRGFRVVIE